MDENQAEGTNQYLTLTLGEEEFALEISRVREVVDYTEITKVPRMPEYLCGVINLRGNVVSVIDLRLKLGMDPISKTTDTCIVIVEVSVDGELLSMGALADSVHEVINLYPDKIDQAPDVGTKLKTEYIQGIGRQNDSFVIILNIDKVFSCDNLASMQNMGETLTHDSESA